jgi:selenocysteine-specific elongation factor
VTVVVGTAGHIDHGKTALLRALTGIDADRLPEERRRGMTIDVGYARLGLPDGTELDFIDVPGHERLVGNMLVGASEMDAVLLVVAADDGPKAQTLEHLALLNALAIRFGLVAITKVDVVDAARVDEVREAVERSLAGTSLEGSSIAAVSSQTGRGIDDLRGSLVELRDRVEASRRTHSTRAGYSRLAIDRTFNVKGRGTVVTGTLRGAAIRRNALLRVVPGGRSVRARELQVHNRAVDEANEGRTAINVADPVGGGGGLRRGLVLTDDPAVVAADRLLVRLDHEIPDRARVRFHIGTAAVDGTIGRSGRDAMRLPGGASVGVVRLSEAVAVAPGDRFVLRRGSDVAAGGIVLDAAPARGLSRRRQTIHRVTALAAAIDAEEPAAIHQALIELHGATENNAGRPALADDVRGVVGDDLLAAVANTPGIDVAAGRARASTTLRRLVTIRRDHASAAAREIIDRLVDAGELRRDGELLFLPGTQREPSIEDDPTMLLAMDRLESVLAHPAPPPLSVAARGASCPDIGIRLLERSGRIVVLEPDLAYASSTYRTIEARALEMAGRGPLTPAALRDATGTSRKYVMAILEDLDRRGVLSRRPEGHVPGPRAGRSAEAVSSASDP